MVSPKRTVQAIGVGTVRQKIAALTSQAEMQHMADRIVATQRPRRVEKLLNLFETVNATQKEKFVAKQLKNRTGYVRVPSAEFVRYSPLVGLTRLRFTPKGIHAKRVVKAVHQYYEQNDKALMKLLPEFREITRHETPQPIAEAFAESRERMKKIILEAEQVGKSEQSPG